jgi:uncharacterized surface protein with fasciclin (FAS1) repeats
MLHLDAARGLHLQCVDRRIARSTANAFAARTCRQPSKLLKESYMSVNRLIGAACAIALGLASVSAHADVMVGGSAMFPQKNIVQNAVNSKVHTTLVAAVKAAGLVDTLQGKGPFTVFAPVNAAFDALPAGTVDTLLKPENKATLTKVLTYHVVPGRLTASELDRLIKEGNGTAELTTASGGKLWVMKNGDRNITIKDEAGAVADISIYDVLQSNGVIHSVDRVLMPK